MKTYVIFSNPVKLAPFFELMSFSIEDIEKQLKSVVVDVYISGNERFIVIKDGNHRISVYLQKFSVVQPEIGNDFANDLLNKVTVQSSNVIHSVKEYLYFKQLVAIQNYVMLKDKNNVFSNRTLTECVNKNLIPTKVSKDAIPFYYLYIYSDQTNGCGCYIKSLLSIIEDENSVVCKFAKLEENCGLNNYNSKHFYSEYPASCREEKCYLFDNTTYTFKKEYNNGILTLKTDTEEINNFFNPLLILNNNNDDDIFYTKAINLDVFDKSFSEGVYFDNKFVPYGLSIFVEDTTWIAPI